MRLPFLFFFLAGFFLLVASCFPNFSFAQTVNTYNNQTSQQAVSQNPNTESNTNSDVPRNLHTHTQTVLLEVMAAAACQLTGIDPTTTEHKCLGFDPKTQKIGYIENGGAIGFMGNMIAVLYTPPAHAGQYFQSLASNFGISKSANAETVDENPNGTGFQGLAPIMPLWEKFRDIVYMMFVIVFVIIGVAVMFRLKIDPRTVMSIQNQIPKIIVGILLVTFSFAIAGFLIDVMYTSIYLMGGAIESAVPSLDKDNTTIKLVQAENPLDAGNIIGGSNGSPGGLVNIAGTPAKGIGKYIASVLDNTQGKIIVGVMSSLVGGYIGNKSGGLFRKALGALGGSTGKWLAGLLCVTGGAAATAGTGGVAAPVAVGGAAACTGIVSSAISLGITTVGPAVAAGAFGAFFSDKIVNGVVSLIAFLIIAVAVLWALIRLWFTLITAYIMLLLDIVFAPFWIVAGLVPGSKISFTNWIRDVVANLAAFVTAIIMFELGRAFIDLFGSANSSGVFVPPLITNPAGTQSIGAIIGLGIILTTPIAVQMMKGMFGAPKFELSSIGQAISVGAGAPGRLIGGAGHAMFTPHYEDQPGGGQKLVYRGGPLGSAMRAFGLVK